MQNWITTLMNKAAYWRPKLTLIAYKKVASILKINSHRIFMKGILSGKSKKHRYQLYYTRSVDTCLGSVHKVD